ncbi:MAG TPA: hypothetical protein VEI74_14365 [Candidatus Methylomirabilis sp.]|nr:hypothetical protein [Candidatus Methylomirabilis sp.]
MESLNDESQELLTRLPGTASRRRAGELDDAVFATLYFFYWQIARHGARFASRKCKRDPRPDIGACLADIASTDGDTLRGLLLAWLDRYQFHGVIANVPVALAQWLRGAWRLALREDIPDPREVLRMQAHGMRPVTVLTAWPRLRQPVLNKPDAFAFFLHDLEHAYKFFHSPALHAGQLAFFAALDRAIDRGEFASYFGDTEFSGKFHYLMSDMNTHPEHSRQYLRAILVEFHRRRERKRTAEALNQTSERAITNLIRVVEIPALLAVRA